jgi:dephospho-CoA kinase
LLRKLNSIVHPEVIKVLKRNIADSSGRVVIIDAPLLLEARLGGLVDALIVVKCPKDEQVSRCMKKFGMKKEEVLSRMRSQMSLAKKIKMADHVVDNKGPKAETRVAVKKIWRQIAWR